MNYEVMGYATIKAQVWSLGDLRELIAQADTWQLRDDCKIDWDYGCVFVDVADTSRGDVMEPIMCGDHYPVRDANGEYIEHADFVITAHKCARNGPEKHEGPETYEEAVEQAWDEVNADRRAEAAARELVREAQRAGLYDWMGDELV